MQNQENKNFNSKLLEFRDKIDQIDNKIIDLLIERSDVVHGVKELKEEFNDKFFVKSAREADMMKNLIKRADGKIPDELILNIWRKIISFSNYFEQEINIALYSPDKDFQYQRLLRSYYNDVIPIREIDNPATIFKDLASKKYQIAFFPILKADNDQKHNKWWINIANNTSAIRVFLKLPFVTKDNEYELIGVAIKDDEKSSQDNSLLVIEQSKDYQESTLRSALSENFEEFNIIKSCDSYLNENDRFFLIEVKGFLDADSEKIKLLSAINSKPFVKIIGVYPSTLK